MRHAARFRFRNGFTVAVSLNGHISECSVRKTGENGSVEHVKNFHTDDEVVEFLESVRLRVGITENYVNQTPSDVSVSDAVVQVEVAVDPVEVTIEAPAPAVVHAAPTS